MSSSKQQSGQKTNDQGYVALGSRSMMLLLKLAGLDNVHIIETKEAFQKELLQYSTESIIITTTNWKQEVEILESYPYTITLPDSPANISDTKDIDILKKQVLGIQTGDNT